MQKSSTDFTSAVVARILSLLAEAISLDGKHIFFPLHAAVEAIQHGALFNKLRPITAAEFKELSIRLEEAGAKCDYVLLNWPSSDVWDMIGGTVALVRIWHQRLPAEEIKVEGAINEAAALCMMLQSLLLYFHHSELVREIRLEGANLKSAPTSMALH